MEGDFHFLLSSMHHNNQVIKKIAMPCIDGRAYSVPQPS